MKRLLVLMLFLILIGSLSMVRDIQPVKSDYVWTETIYIRADGSIAPLGAPVSTVDNATYALTDNIVEVTSADYAGAIIVERDNTVLDGAGYTLQGVNEFNANPEYIGINLDYRSNVTIENMVIKQFFTGVSVVCSSNTGIVGNNIADNVFRGIYLKDSVYNIVSENTIEGNGEAGGINLERSYNNTISGNIFANDGLMLYYSYDNVVVNNLVNGKPMVYLEDVSDVAVQDAGQVVLVDCNRIQVENLSLPYSSNVGVGLYSTGNSTITGNNITGKDHYGIYLGDSSNNNTISGNTIKNSFAGIQLQESCGNTITANDIGNNEIGVYFYWYSNNNTVLRNDLTNNSQRGVHIRDCSCYNIIIGNTLANSFGGISILYDSDYNIVVGNTIKNNEQGLRSFWEECSGNKLVHNSFINNTQQAYLNYHYSPPSDVWDDGYPSGGNYWSDYNGTDMYNGPNQNVIGSDGIGDTPYVIDESNQDNYPLMGPWTKAGENASVTLPNDVFLVFANVTFGGITTINVTTFEPDRPMGFILAAEPYVYYDIETTANYSGIITVSIAYDDANMTLEEENDLKLMHWDETLQSWVNVTTFVDVTNNIIYGQTSSLSPFAIMLQTIPGDVDGDYYVNAKDAVILGGAFGSKRGDPTYSPNADINSDDWCNAKDAVILGTYFGQHWS